MLALQKATQTVVVLQNDLSTVPCRYRAGWDAYVSRRPDNLRGGVAARGTARKSHIPAQTVEILQGGGTIASASTDGEGRYRLNGVHVDGPSLKFAAVLQVLPPKPAFYGWILVSLITVKIFNYLLPN